MKNFILLFTLLLLNASLTFSQVFKNDLTKSTITIQGTSNLHDWTSKSTGFNVSLIINDNKIDKLDVIIPVKSIKSGEKLMDTKTYETFSADKYPNITLKLSEVDELKITETTIIATFAGSLSMSGVTKKITLKAVGKKVNENTYRFTSNTSIKMSDFNMKPPVALLGTLKVGNEVKLILDIYLIK